MSEDMPAKLRAELAEIGDDTIERLIGDFEAAAHRDDDGNEFWFARDLQKLLEYEKWENFERVIKAAMSACSQSGHEVARHWLPDVRKSISGKGRQSEIADFRMSRYASYLVAQNGDSRKQPIAFAQTYFAIQTRRQEVQDRQGKDFSDLSEEQKRISLRDEMKEHNKALVSAAKDAGVETDKDYAIFQSHGYQGLYGGLNVSGIRQAKGLTKSAKILDHMGSTELAANLFRATQTEEKLRRENIQGKKAANETHLEVGRKVRNTIKDIGGTMPEKLPAAEDIRKVEKKLSEQLKRPKDV